MERSFSREEINLTVSLIVRRLSNKYKENPYRFSTPKNQIESIIIENNLNNGTKLKRTSLNDSNNQKNLSNILLEKQILKTDFLKHIFSKEKSSLKTIEDLNKFCEKKYLKKILCNKENKNYLENRYLFKIFSEKNLSSKFKKQEIFQNAFLFKKSPIKIQINIIYLQINEIFIKYKRSCVIYEKKIKKIKFLKGIITEKNTFYKINNKDFINDIKKFEKILKKNKLILFFDKSENTKKKKNIVKKHTFLNLIYYSYNIAKFLVEFMIFFSDCIKKEKKIENFKIDLGNFKNFKINVCDFKTFIDIFEFYGDLLKDNSKIFGDFFNSFKLNIKLDNNWNTEIFDSNRCKFFFYLVQNTRLMISNYISFLENINL